jgi:hypothetical protein
LTADAPQNTSCCDVNRRPAVEPLPLMFNLHNGLCHVWSVHQLLPLLLLLDVLEIKLLDLMTTSL